MFGGFYFSVWLALCFMYRCCLKLVCCSAALLIEIVYFPDNENRNLSFSFHLTRRLFVKNESYKTHVNSQRALKGS